MSTTHRKSREGTNAPSAPAMTALVDTTRADDDAAYFVYAVIAALGINIVELHDADDGPYGVTIQVRGSTILAQDHQWHFPDHEATFERWLAETYFPAPEQSTVWAVVQTGAERFELLAAAMAYAYRDDGALLIDADASTSLSQRIHSATQYAVDVLPFDFDLPSPHIYVLNAPRWKGVSMLLQTSRTNPLNSSLLINTVQAARRHFAHTIIDCGADLFLAQRLAAAGVRIIHIDDYSRPLHVELTPYKRIDYFAHTIPPYGTRSDFEFLVHNTRRRATMRRWLNRGDTA